MSSKASCSSKSTSTCRNISTRPIGSTRSPSATPRLGAVVCLPLERGAAIEPEIARVAGLQDDARRAPADPEPARPRFHAAARRFSRRCGCCRNTICRSTSASFIRNCRTRSRWCAAVPRSRFVLDHIGKPGIKAGLDRSLARRKSTNSRRCPNVVCKLSGVTTEADHNPGRASNSALHRSRDRPLRPGPHSLRRRLAGLGTRRRLSAMADDARLGDGGLSAGDSASCSATTRSGPIVSNV